MIRLNSFLIFLLFFFTHTSTQAIVPIDTAIQPKKGLSGDIGADLNGKYGTQDEQEYNLNFVGRYSEGETLYLLINDYNYGETNNIKDEDDFFLHFRVIKNNVFAPKLDLEVFSQYQYDEFDDLSSRKLVGSGLRWRIDRQNEPDLFNSSFGAGLFYEEEVSQVLREEKNAWRGNFYAKWIWKKKGQFPFDLYGRLYLQPVINDVENLRATGVAGVKFVLTKTLSFRMELESEYDSEPFAEAETTKSEYAVSLTYAF